MGFTGPERGPLLEQMGVDLDDRGNVARSSEWATNVEGVFVAGDAGRGQSLIVWAIAEGRSCAAAVNAFLKATATCPRRSSRRTVRSFDTPGPTAETKRVARFAVSRLSRYTFASGAWCWRAA